MPAAVGSAGSGRLDRIISLIRPGDCLADIGTDHAYVPIAAVSQGLCRRALACDIVPGPLERARANIAAAGLSERIEVLHGDGLKPLGAEQPDCIVIAGMGGPLMQRILREGGEKIGPNTQLILSPQSELMEFRTFLWESGMEIRREALIEEEGKFYVILDCGLPVEGDTRQRPLPHELRFGRKLDCEAEDLALRQKYIQKDLRVAKAILQQLEGNPSEAAERRRAELEQQIRDAFIALND